MINETIFSKFARKYDQHSWPQFEVGKKLLREVDIKNKDVLEIGCHAGKLSIEIAKEAKKVIGVDLAKKAIEIAKKKSKKNKIKNLKFLVRNVENLKLNEKFDVVVCNIAFHVFKDKKKALKEIRKVLKKKGIIVLTFPIEGIKNEEEFRKIYFDLMDSKYKNYESKIRFPTPKGFNPKKHIEGLFDSQGFNILKIMEKHPTFFFKDEKDYMKHYEGSSPAKNYLKHLPVKFRSKAKKELLKDLRKKITKKGLKITWGYLLVVAQKDGIK